MAASATGEIFAALGLAVFSRNAAGKFETAGPLPGWWKHLTFDRHSDSLSQDLIDCFPFVQHFLEDANAFWSRQRQGRIDSGIWEFPVGEGHVLYLQLYAVHCRPAADLLVFQDLESAGIQLHDYVQRGRENHLEALRQATQREKLQVELRRAAEAAQRLDQSRLELLANVSHELRTPVTAILGLLELVEGSTSQAPDASLLQGLRSAAQDLRRLVNDLLESARLRSETLSICPAEFDLDDWLADIRRSFADRAAEKQLELRIEKNEGLPPRCWGDVTRLKQLFGNLIDNAIKFTDAGEVALRLAPVEDRSGWYEISVSDTGIGLSPDHQQLVFDAFVQIDSTDRPDEPGIGLGLSLCQRLVDAMDGNLELTSTVGRGSTFAVQLPLVAGRLGVDTETATATDSLFSTSVAASPLRILVVEDNAINRQFIKLSLEKAGHDVVVAEEGAAAIALAQNSDFDVMLLDCRMPRISGFETVRRLREHERSHGSYLPVVAITAHATVQDAARCREAGMDSYLSKPFTSHQLMTKVASISRLKRMSVLARGKKP